MPLSDTSSVGSTRSLRSHGSFSVDEPMGSQREPAASRRPATHWEFEEEKALIAFLATRKSEAGDTMSFKNTVFTDATAHINTMFPAQKGAPKSQSSCKSKWAAVSSITLDLLVALAHTIAAQKEL